MTEGTDGALENLVNQIAHDVRNHAFTIGLQAEMGLRRAQGSPAVSAHFEAVLRQVDVLKHYLEQLLLYGRPARLTLTPVDLLALVHEQVERLQAQWQGDGSPLAIEVIAEGPLRPGQWDGRALAHALTALLDNAARSDTPPPPIAVAVQAEARGVVVEIRDAGPGIPPDVLARVAVPMAVRRPGGAGLGLAITRKIAEAHGGRLEISSTSSGTTARVTLPWEAGARPGAVDG